MFVADMIRTHESKKGQRGGILALFSSGKRKSQSKGKDKIVIIKNMLHIVTNRGYVAQEVDIDQMDRILMDDPYNVGFGNIPNHYRDFGRKNAKNLLILEKDGDTQKFEFAIDSTHSMCELRKQILHWKSLGHVVLDKNLNIDLV